MNHDVTYLRDRLAAANPAPQPEVDPDMLDAEGRAAMERVLASPREPVSEDRRLIPARRRPLRIGAVAAAAVVLVLAVVFVAVSPLQREPQQAYAATPPALAYQRAEDNAPPARDLLLRLAERAAQQPAPQRQQYYYVKTRSWYLSTAVSGGKSCSAVAPSTAEKWIAKDGSGRTITKDDASDTPSGKNGWLCDAASQEAGTYEETRGPTKGLRWPTDGLSRDPQRLARQITHDIMLGGMPTKIELIEFFQLKMHAKAPVPPRLQAALLRVLADIPGIANRGHVTDRAGRDGVAVSVSSSFSGGPTSYTLILDPDTGALLGYEEMLTGDPGALNVPIPSVVSYTVYLDHGFTDNVNRRPE